MTRPPVPVTTVPDVLGRRERHETGMTTSEYAVGTVGACGVGSLLWVLLDDDYFRVLLVRLFGAAPQVLELVFGGSPGVPGVSL